ncbi:hypothetical protein SESBI_47658 [Sesbania bispinosa]|nr:hypothetical protein SESBI_47658 [Sesbania bispinosa]
MGLLKKPAEGEIESRQKAQVAAFQKEMLQLLEEELQGDVHKEEFKFAEVTPEKKEKVKKQRTKVSQKNLSPADLEKGERSKGFVSKGYFI